jgi:hypothetical protein
VGTEVVATMPEVNLFVKQLLQKVPPLAKLRQAVGMSVLAEWVKIGKGNIVLQVPQSATRQATMSPPSVTSSIPKTPLMPVLHQTGPSSIS